ncbi:MAG TPA: hypothetical protein VJ829_06430, partial [Candidatus Binatia bacterium]|nr:hypothetical protein [Candidatus Binatia bacterium]
SSVVDRGAYEIGATASTSTTTRTTSTTSTTTSTATPTSAITSSTLMTTTTMPGQKASTTTVPVAPPTTTTQPTTCVDTAVGLSAVRCRLGLVADVLRTTPADRLGGRRSAKRLRRSLGRASVHLAAAELRGMTAGRLGAVARDLHRFRKQVVHANSRIAGDVGHRLLELVDGAADHLGALAVL